LFNKKGNDNWVQFYAKRLEFQLSLIEQNFKESELLKYGKQLISQLPRFFDGIEVKPSLIHGDLWAGNWGADR
jgi:protein-ribulosamine 3-kinase